MNSKQRRTIDRATKTILTSLQDNIASTERVGKEQKSAENRKWWIGLFLTIVLGLPTLLGLRAHPTVSTEPPYDPKNVYTTPLVVANDSLLNLNDVHIVTFVIQVFVPPFGPNEQNSIGGSFALQPSIIQVGGKKTILLKSFLNTDVGVVGSDIALIVKYSPEFMPFWTKRNAFRFTVGKDSNGNLRFEQEPGGNALDLYYAAMKRVLQNPVLNEEQRERIKGQI
jgi:hypothetical protein